METTPIGTTAPAVDAAPSDASLVRWIRVLGRLATVALGAVHAAAAVAHQSMNPDGIAYLDMADAFFRGDWAMALNAYWSPLYAWLLGAGTRIGAVGPEDEFAAVQLVNLAIYLWALGCFEFFWREIVRRARPDRGRVGFPDWILWALGYGLFVVTALQMIRLWSVTPDMCVAACVYLASGFLLRWLARDPSPWLAGAFGAALGLAYLAKAAMFPLAFVFLGCALALRPDRRRALPSWSVAVLAFALVAGPFLVALSRSEGHLTFGESGRLNYVWFVNRIPYPHWQGGDHPTAPDHPTRRVSENPPIYEFAEPIGGTYPPWYDPPYWCAGVEPHFDWGQQIRVLAASSLSYGELFGRSQVGLTVVLLSLYVVAAARGRPVRELAGQGALLVPALSAMAMYAVVLVEERYIGPFVLLFWAGLLCGLRPRDEPGSSRLLAAGGLALLLSLGLSVVGFNLEPAEAALAHLRFPPEAAGGAAVAPAAPPSHITTALVEAGIRPGDSIGLIGYGFDAFWARQARVRIVAELYPWDAPDLWDLDAPTYSRMLEGFARSGVRAIVAEGGPDRALPAEWRRLGSTGHIIHFVGD